MTGVAGRGWCPSLHQPMPSGDGLLVRVKPPGSMLRADQARTLARAALSFGNGVIELTSRANLQVRGLSEATAAPFARAMIEAGLGSDDAGAEQRRNVIASTLAGDDPAVVTGTAELARAAEAMLQEAEFAELPPKFGLVIDGGGALPLGDAPGDLRVRLEAGRALLAADGMHRAAVCSADQLLPTLRRIITALLALGTGHRLRELDGDAFLATAGVRASVPFAAGAGVSPIGWHCYPGTGRGAFGVGAAFGQLESRSLEILADAAQRRGDGTLRITSGRAFLLSGVRARAAAAVRDETHGLVTDPADPTLGIAACAGMPRCAHASVATRQDAAWLALSRVARGRTIHVSGCAKGCAHSGPAAVTLVGLNGRYGLVRDGRADAVPVLQGLTIAEAAQAVAEVAA